MAAAGALSSAGPSDERAICPECGTPDSKKNIARHRKTIHGTPGLGQGNKPGKKLDPGRIAAIGQQLAMKRPPNEAEEKARKEREKREKDEQNARRRGEMGSGPGPLGRLYPSPAPSSVGAVA